MRGSRWEHLAEQIHLCSATGCSGATLPAARAWGRAGTGASRSSGATSEPRKQGRAPGRTSTGLKELGGAPQDTEARHNSDSPLGPPAPAAWWPRSPAVGHSSASPHSSPGSLWGSTGRSRACFGHGPKTPLDSIHRGGLDCGWGTLQGQARANA